MIKLLSIAGAATAVIAAGLAALPAPAAAQSKLGEAIVFGTDPCPRSTDSEIVVCRRYPESERYRVSPQLRTSGPRQVRESWAKKSEDLKTVGATGIGACSPVGPGGHTGCLIQEITRAKKEANESIAERSAPE